MRVDNRAAVLAAAGLLAMPGMARAEDDNPDSWRISTGVNYSQGDYGDTRDTKVVSAPVAVKYQRGGFSLRVSIPYVHIDGPGSLLDTPQGRDGGFGGSDDAGSDDNGGASGGSGSDSSGSGSSGSGNSGSGNSGSGNSGSGGSGGGGSDDGGTGGSSGGGEIAPGAGLDNRRSGIGDVSVSLGYSFELGDTTWLDVTGRLKLPTASRAKRLGTGKVDVTVGAELVQDLGKASVFVGARRKFLGQPVGTVLRDTWGVGAGANYRLDGGVIIGADYDWQQSSTRGRRASSEATGWVNFPVSRQVRMQLFASTGFNTNSTDFAGGLSLSYRFD